METSREVVKLLRIYGSWLGWCIERIKDGMVEERENIYSEYPDPDSELHKSVRIARNSTIPLTSERTHFDSGSS